MVDLNPYQVDAALFAFRSPLSRVPSSQTKWDCGKTIEAGIIGSQLWAEKKRRILVHRPASLRKQWSQELAEKFFIPSLILESKSYRELSRKASSPFQQSNQVVICSYQFARAKAADIMAVPWDLVVIDEAHRLRNVYKKDNKIARAPPRCAPRPAQVLLTATPLQNSLMELFGLVSFVDEHVFGSEEAFRELYAKKSDTLSAGMLANLRARHRADLPAHAPQAGHRVRPVHQTHPDYPGFHPVARGAAVVRSGVRVSSAGQPPRAPEQPAATDRTCPPQDPGLVVVRHLRHARHDDRPAEET